MSATVATIKAATGALCSAASHELGEGSQRKARSNFVCSPGVALTSGLQSFTIDSCALSLEVLYKARSHQAEWHVLRLPMLIASRQAMVYIEDASAENDGSFAPVDVMVPSNGFGLRTTATCQNSLQVG